MSGAYDDIINLPHHVSATRAHMPMHDRAAQFSPFAALSGYEAAVKETARLTDCRIEEDEYLREQLNAQLTQIAANTNDTCEYKITYFKPDENKSGGEYITVYGEIIRVDSFNQIVKTKNGVCIPIADIYSIEKNLSV